MQNVNDLISFLDSQVLCAFQAYDFSDSHLLWGNELNRIFSNVYESVVQRTKEDTRAVARNFREERQVVYLLHNLEDLIKQHDMLRLTLSAADLLMSRQSLVPGLQRNELGRIWGGVPNLHCTMRSISEGISRWRDDVSAALDTFCILGGPEEVLEELLASLPGAIPNTYITQGKDLIDQFVSMWAERRAITVQAAGLSPESEEFQKLLDRLNSQRDDQQCIIGSFTGLISQIIDMPPFHFLNLEFTAHQLAGASWLYEFLLECCSAIDEQMGHLQSIVEASQE